MVINGKVWNPGEMRTQVTLLSRSITTATGGFQVAGTATIATVWAKWVNVHGAEAWSQGALEATMPATATIRWRADVDTSCLVRKGSDTFEIVSMDDIQERHELIELRLRRVVGG